MVTEDGYGDGLEKEEEFYSYKLQSDRFLLQFVMSCNTSYDLISSFSFVGAFVIGLVYCVCV